MLVAAAILAGAAAAPGLTAQSGPRVLLEAGNPLEIVRFNRAEGLSLGFGVTAGFRGTMTAAVARARYSIGDERPQGMLGLRHTGEGGTTELSVFSEMREADPLAPGLLVTNSIPALLLSHDEGSYVFGSGAELRRTMPFSWATELTVTLSYADETAPRATTGSGLAYDFPPNTPVRPGRYVVAGATLAGGEIGGDDTWYAGLEGSAGEASFVRGWLGLTRRREIGSGLDVALAGWAGAGDGDVVPQRYFRLGGNRTLRGYDAGSFGGTWAWNLGVDVGAAHRVVAPVVFADLGQARGSDPAAAVGVGVSIMRGMARAHVATPVDGPAEARFDIMFAVRR